MGEKKILHKKILVVEDMEGIRMMLRRSIHKLFDEVEVVLCESAEEAMDVVEVDSFDLLILDIGLPTMNGIELAECLRKKKEYRMTPIIFISAYESKELEAYRRVHCFTFMRKPYKDEELDHAIQECMEYENKEESPIPAPEKELLVFKNNDRIFIPQKEILYVERVQRKLCIHLPKEKIHTDRYSLVTIASVLEDFFVRCHQGYIINMKQVKKIDVKAKKIYIGENGNHCIPLGRRYLGEVKSMV